MNIALSLFEIVRVLLKSVLDGVLEESRDCPLGGLSDSLSRSSSMGMADEKAALGRGGEGDGASARRADNVRGAGAPVV